jgi:hypothetical protein
MRKELIGIYKKNIERRTGLKLDFVNNEDNYIIGKKYFCGYWQEIFEVLDYKKVKDLGVVTIK